MLDLVYAYIYRVQRASGWVRRRLLNGVVASPIPLCGEAPAVVVDVAHPGGEATEQL